MAETYLGERVETFQYLFHDFAFRSCSVYRKFYQAGGRNLADHRIQRCADHGLF